MLLIPASSLDLLKLIGGGFRIHSSPGVAEKPAGQRLNPRR